MPYEEFLDKGKVNLSCDKNAFKDFETKIFKEIETKNEGLISKLL